MKNLILTLTLLMIFVFSCKKDEITPDNDIAKKDTIKTSINDLKFKLCPNANDKFKFSVLNEDDKTYRLYLKKDNQNLANYLLVDENVNSSISSVMVNYSFSQDEVYQIIVEVTKENADTVFQETFTINGYTHKYCNQFSYEKLASITQNLDFDISPSRNTIFFIDYINNKFVLKRLSIADKSIEVLDENFFSLLVRSKSDNQLIVSNRFYNNRYLGSDSCALLIYDINTHATSFIDWGSADYGRFSRVVDNSIMVSNPYNTGAISLIDFSDNSRRKYTADIRNLYEYSFDHIYLGNELLDHNSGSFVSKLPSLGVDANIVYYDENSQYIITVEYFRESEQLSSVYTRMIIYKNNEIVYEQQFEKGRAFTFPRLINLADNKLIFYQNYEFSSAVRFDGYYLLDIGTKETTLLQNESEFYLKHFFFNEGDKNSFISVGPYDINRVTIN